MQGFQGQSVFDCVSKLFLAKFPLFSPSYFLIQSFSPDLATFVAAFLNLKQTGPSGMFFQ